VILGNAIIVLGASGAWRHEQYGVYVQHGLGFIGSKL